MNTALHPFEAAGLGKAPFRCIGFSEERGPIKHYDPKTGITMEIGSPGQPMGCCKYCGQGIANVFLIRDAEGKKFTVGSVCVDKTNDRRLKAEVDVHTREIRKAQREARVKGEEARIEKAKALWESDEFSDARAEFRSRPHPMIKSSEYTAEDYVQYLFDRGGHSGRLRAARSIERIQKARVSEGIGDE